MSHYAILTLMSLWMISTADSTSSTSSRCQIPGDHRSSCTGADSTGADRTFRAAVYEHAVVLPAKTNISVSRQRALENMERNLVTYMIQAEKAREQGVNILVFPEDGLYGYEHTRASIYPYLEAIPDPRTVTWSPCDDPTRFPDDTEVQIWLSCLAKNNSLYLVADMGDKVLCDVTRDAKCPPDGRYQFNTAVVYGPDGTLLAKYHKTNLYYEYQFDMPDPQVTYFDTPFGRFGFLICFDVLFKEPAISMLTDYGIKNIVFPTAWMDSLPLLSAIGYHSSFARGHKVNFLASNLHIPDRRFQGSGIYTADGAEAFYYNRTSGSGPKLLVADLKVLDDARPARQLGRNDDLISSDRHMVIDEVSENSSDRHMVIDEANENRHISQVNSFINSYRTSSQPFSNLNFTFVLLDSVSSHTKVCRDQVCCYLSYTRHDTSGNDMFVLGAFDGLFHNKYYFQVCTILRCPQSQTDRCGEYTYDSNTVFKSVTLSAEMNSPYTLPQVVVRRGDQFELAQQDQWLFNHTARSLQFIPDIVDLPVIEVSIVGRHYDRTPVVIFG